MYTQCAATEQLDQSLDQKLRLITTVALTNQILIKIYV